MVLSPRRGGTFLSAQKVFFVAVRIFATLANTKCIFSLFKNESLRRFLTTVSHFRALFATTDFGVTVWGAHICYPGQYKMHIFTFQKCGTTMCRGTAKRGGPSRSKKRHAVYKNYMFTGVCCVRLFFSKNCWPEPGAGALFWGRRGRRPRPAKIPVDSIQKKVSWGAPATRRIPYVGMRNTAKTHEQ